MIYFVAVFLTILAVVSSAALGPYKISDTTVSGLSSGGYMAVQVHVAFSSFVNGSAIFAGVSFTFSINSKFSKLTTTGPFYYYHTGTFLLCRRKFLDCSI
jgi:hypothetical protein